MIGKKLSPVLTEIADTLWEFEAQGGLKPNYTEDAFKASTKIFMSALMDKLWNLQQTENMEVQDRLNMAQKAGEDLRKLIKTYTNIDTHEFY